MNGIFKFVTKIYQRIVKSDEFVEMNSEMDFNEQQICWSIIVFIFAYWDEEIRPKVATIRGIPPNYLKLDEYVDLRILRKNIIHNGGILPNAEYQRLKIIKNFVKSDSAIYFSHDQMHKLFIHLKQGIFKLILEHIPGAPSNLFD